MISLHSVSNEPTQTTEQGLEIRVPTRAEVLADRLKIAKKVGLVVPLDPIPDDDTPNE